MYDYDDEGPMHVLPRAVVGLPASARVRPARLPPRGGRPHHADQLRRRRRQPDHLHHERGQQALRRHREQGRRVRVDEIVDDRATSVIIRGRAKILEGQDRYIIEQLPIRPWVPSPKSVVVAIEVDEISAARSTSAVPGCTTSPHH